MPPEWTGEVIGIMHNNRVSFQRVANAVGWNVKYLSAVMNGKRQPAGAEVAVRDALARILEGREQ